MTDQSRRWPRRAFKNALALYGLVAIPSPGTASLQEIQRVRRAQGDEALSLRLEEVLAIGSLADDESSFGRISDVAWDNRGRLLVTDNYMHHFKVFEADGSYVRTVGREGEGPGEFSAPSRIVVDASDSVYVWDSGQSRIHVFSPDLAFVRRSVVTPPWVVNSMTALEPDRIVVTAMTAGEQRPIKVLDKKGAVLRTAGPQIDPSNLPMYVGSLLGGRLARTPTGFAYSNKSPWSVWWLDDDFRVRRICRGPASWTTAPEDVVVQEGLSIRLQWNRYVRSAASLVALPGGLLLNAVRDPVAGAIVFQVVTDDCVVAAEIELDGPVIPTSSNGDLALRLMWWGGVESERAGGRTRELRAGRGAERGRGRRGGRGWRRRSGPGCGSRGTGP